MNKLSWRTWSGTTRCAPDALITPRTEAEIVAGIALAAERGLSVRVAGTGHSFNRLVCTDGVILDLSRYRGVTAVDPRAGTVTVRGGTSLRELIAVLRRRG